jgi:hypothetical protein
MDKKLIVGGLAVVGAIALFMYLKPKPKKNSDGFFNAQGMSRFYQQTSDRNKSHFKNASGKTVSAYYKR